MIYFLTVLSKKMFLDKSGIPPIGEKWQKGEKNK